jgi:hypothetical protein
MTAGRAHGEQHQPCSNTLDRLAVCSSSGGPWPALHSGGAFFSLHTQSGFPELARYSSRVTVCSPQKCCTQPSSATHQYCARVAASAVSRQQLVVGAEDRLHFPSKAGTQSEKWDPKTGQMGPGMQNVHGGEPPAVTPREMGPVRGHPRGSPGALNPCGASATKGCVEKPLVN